MPERRSIRELIDDLAAWFPDAMLVVDSACVIVGVNQTACDLFAYTREELVGQPLERLVPDGRRGSHGALVAGYLEVPRVRAMGSGLDLSARRKDGTTLPVDISLAPFEADTARFVVAAVRDVSARKRTEMALRESEERFDLAVRGTDAGIWDWDLRTGRLFLSDRWKSMLGYAPDEIAPEFDAWKSRIHPDDRERALATVDAYLSGRTTEYELEHRLRHKDGGYRWILARGAAVRDDQGKPYRMVGSHIDVTGRKVAEEALLRRESELIAAASIQRFLLPHHAPSIPGFDIAGRCYPAEYTAGDYFDYVGFHDGAVAVLVADVTGHGLGPAILAASCHSCIQSLSESLSDPAEILARLNGRIFQETQAELLVSMAVARIEPIGRVLTCYNAGHPPVLVLDALGRVKARLESESLLMGVVPEITVRPSIEVALQPGDLVLLYTDGLTEAHPAGGTEIFTLDRALEVVRAHQRLPAADVAEALHRAVCRHLGTDRLDDDVTVVVVKVDAQARSS
jgi:PAS domain S-box-containing protein